MAQPQQAEFGAHVRVPKMAELVASRLRKQIIDGDLLEGDSLPSEAVLMQQFGVSRPTLREAYRVLESEALITVRRGAHGGARVHVPDSDVVARYAALVLEYQSVTLRDVYRARVVLEPACAAMAAERRPAANLDQLWAAVADAERSVDDPLRFIEQQTSFHKLLVSASGNQTMLLLYEMVQRIIETSNIVHVQHDAGTPANIRANKKGVRAHRRVVELIQERDAEGAVQLWRKHLDEAEDYLLGSDDPVTVLDLLG
ncbi:MAG TPA: FadR/GntR family transcriptional regulator [Streptosporangiaceae bacterium]|jgi:DNA-binding FadR family transcriptional regulator|nr:FadR/GntR family transcriptional regulator [Streptosporangiaceae bacterium]